MIASPVTQADIKKSIDSLQSRKSVGADEITAEILKKNQKWLIPVLEIIINNC